MNTFSINFVSLSEENTNLLTYSSVLKCSVGPLVCFCLLGATCGQIPILKPFFFRIYSFIDLKKICLLGMKNGNLIPKLFF